MATSSAKTWFNWLRKWAIPALANGKKSMLKLLAVHQKQIEARFGKN